MTAPVNGIPRPIPERRLHRRRRRGFLRRNRGRLLLGLAGVLLLGLVVATLAGREALGLRRDLLRAQAEFNQAVAVTDPVLADFGSFRETSAALTRSATHLAAADEALASAERRRARLAPLLTVPSWVPGWTEGLGDVAPLIGSARELARSGLALSDAFTRMTERLDASSGSAEPAGERLSAGLTLAEPEFRQALAALEAARVQREQIGRRTFSGPLRPANSALTTFDLRYRALHDNATVLVQLPPAARSVLGMDGARTYAVLGQNSAELRPTGGFLGSMGLVTIDRGAITVEDYRGVYTFERPERGYGPAPAPLVRHLGGRGWGLRDANWSPDFPTSARKVEELLRYYQEVEVDGVLGFTTFAVGGLLEALGPLPVPGFAEPVMAASWYDLAERLIYFPDGTSTGIAEEAKGEVLGPVLQAMVARLQSASSAELPALLRALQSLLQQRQILLYFHDPAAEAMARRYEADGALTAPAQGDVLAVVDANLSFSKVGPYIQERIEYEAWLNGRGVPEASRVTITYANTITPEQAADPTRRIGGIEFDATTGIFTPTPGLFGTYLRVYIPAKSRVVDAGPRAVEVFSGAELGFLTLEQYESVPAASTRSVSYGYQIPVGILQRLRRHA